eukprot:1070801-Prorocentrum_minimum.AAC.1
MMMMMTMMGSAAACRRLQAAGGGIGSQEEDPASDGLPPLARPGEVVVLSYTLLQHAELLPVMMSHESYHLWQPRAAIASYYRLAYFNGPSELKANAHLLLGGKRNLKPTKEGGGGKVASYGSSMTVTVTLKCNSVVPSSRGLQKVQGVRKSGQEIVSLVSTPKTDYFLA